MPLIDAPVAGNGTPPIKTDKRNSLKSDQPFERQEVHQENIKSEK